jgi:hypothetical protein
LTRFDFRGVLGVDEAMLLGSTRDIQGARKAQEFPFLQPPARARKAGPCPFGKHIASGSPILDGISLAFIPHMPRLDLAKYGLNSAWSDDVLIASALDYKALLAKSGTAEAGSSNRGSVLRAE